MKAFAIEKTKFTPGVIFDSTVNEWLFEGRSQSDDISEFYKPVLKELTDCLESGIKKLNVTFKLEYFNTSSAKIIVDILLKLKQAEEMGMLINTTWYVDNYDEDMKEAVVQLAEISDLNIEVIIVDS